MKEETDNFKVLIKCFQTRKRKLETTAAYLVLLPF